MNLTIALQIGILQQVMNTIANMVQLQKTSVKRNYHSDSEEHICRKKTCFVKHKEKDKCLLKIFSEKIYWTQNEKF